jgi:hypothetical protein
MATVVTWPTGKTSDEITGKIVNETRQVRTHTWAPDNSPKLKSLQDLSIRINPKVTKEVMHHVGLWVDGGLHLHLHVCKVIHLSLESFDPFHHETHHRVFPNRWFRGWWEALHPNQPSQVSSPRVFSRHHIYIFPREEGSLSCLRLTQGVTPMSTTRLYGGYVNWG